MERRLACRKKSGSLSHNFVKVPSKGIPLTLPLPGLEGLGSIFVKYSTFILLHTRTQKDEDPVSVLQTTLITKTYIMARRCSGNACKSYVLAILKAGEGHAKSVRILAYLDSRSIIDGCVDLLGELTDSITGFNKLRMH
ncbi:hypothetical protein VNO77_27744 [Canavalia gladiata]|uniref:Uncharacterized protein n=1 Tax=Canavalia gladiata TaxID=3824 RepID=A0AAN9Q6S3_CANGL